MKDRSAQRFSGRFSYAHEEEEILVREEAPNELRLAIVHFTIDAGLAPDSVRDVVLETLSVPPEPQLWRVRKHVIKEIQRQIGKAEWYEVYDVAEALHQRLLGESRARASQLAERLNGYLRKKGIGWKLLPSGFEMRGPEAFEKTLTRAKSAFEDHGLPTAQSEMHEALLDLSRRPKPDLTGAMHHGIAALECVAREASGDRTLTLGEILKKNLGLVPRPLDTALHKIWGYASEMGRHVREGRSPERAEAELVVELAAVLATYLSAKIGEAGANES